MLNQTLYKLLVFNPHHLFLEKIYENIFAMECFRIIVDVETGEESFGKF